MEKIFVLGLGPGNPEYITPIVKNAIVEADIVIGGKRNIQSISHLLADKEVRYIDSGLDKLVRYIMENREQRIAVVVSGDPGFYSFLGYMKKNFKSEELQVLPGISSMQYMFSRIGEMWADAYIGSVHGKKIDYVKKLEKYRKIGLLTDKENSPKNIAITLKNRGYGRARIWVGEKLSYCDERIHFFSAENLSEYEGEFGINVVVVKLEDLS
jgi:cobalt-precorrin-7 (C5)-methyltransferase